MFQEESRDPVVRANICPPTKQAFQVQNNNSNATEYNSRIEEISNDRNEKVHDVSMRDEASRLERGVSTAWTMMMVGGRWVLSQCPFRLDLVQWQGELCLLFPFLRPRRLLYRAYGNHEISLDPPRSLWHVHPSTYDLRVSPLLIHRAGCRTEEGVLDSTGFASRP